MSTTKKIEKVKVNTESLENEIDLLFEELHYLDTTTESELYDLAAAARTLAAAIDAKVNSLSESKGDLFTRARELKRLILNLKN